MKKENRFITFVNDVIAGWEIHLPAPRHGIEPLIRFATTVAKAGQLHAVYRLERLPGRRGYDAREESFEEYLLARVRESERLPLFPEDQAPGKELWTPARLAFYRDSACVEEDVGDVGGLLRELRPDRIETAGMFMRRASPVTVCGGSFPLDWTESARVVIRLDTDIWFPSVMGMLEALVEEGEQPESYDNRELAARHTPRLNAFLEELRGTVLDLGGTWGKIEVSGVGVNYAHLWNERGIEL